MIRQLTVCMIALAIATYMAAPSHAALVWDQTPNAGDTIELKFKNWEEIVDVDNSRTPGDPTDLDGWALPDTQSDQLRGIFKITNILGPGGTPLWHDGFAGQELTGYFWGYEVSGIDEDSSTTDNFYDFILGFAEIFIGDFTNTSTKFNPAYGGSGNALVPHGSGFDDGELWLELKGEIGEPALAGSAAPPTLVAEFDKPPGATGKGLGYFDIVGGSGMGLFVPDGMDQPPGAPRVGSQDLKFDSIISQGTDFWPASSNDPIRGVVMPEPSSLLVWGMLGLCSLVSVRRSRLRKTGKFTEASR